MRVRHPLVVNEVAAQGLAQSRRGEPGHDRAVPIGEGTEREQHTARAGQNHPGDVHNREGRLRAHRTGNQQAQRRKGRRTQQQGEEGSREGDGVRTPTQAVPDHAHEHELDNQYDHHGDALAQNQAVAAQGSGRQKAKHAVAAVEARCDALARQRSGDDAEGQHAGDRRIHTRNPHRVGVVIN